MLYGGRESREDKKSAGGERVILKQLWIFYTTARFEQRGGTQPHKNKSQLSDDGLSVAPVAYQVILEPGIGHFREFEPRRVHTRINSLGLFLVHKLTCGERESVS